MDGFDENCFRGRAGDLPDRLTREWFRRRCGRRGSPHFEDSVRDDGFFVGWNPRCPPEGRALQRRGGPRLALRERRSEWAPRREPNNPHATPACRAAEQGTQENPKAQGHRLNYALPRGLVTRRNNNRKRPRVWRWGQRRGTIIKSRHDQSAAEGYFTGCQGSFVGTNSTGTCFTKAFSHVVHSCMPICSLGMWPITIKAFFRPWVTASAAYSTVSHSRVSPTSKTCTLSLSRA